MARYAANTSVSVAKSKAEIEGILQRYGCTGFVSGWKESQAMISFQINDRLVKFLLPMPNQLDDEFILTETGRERSGDAAYKAWEKACRQRWRSLALAIKAKLEAVECGIVTFDQEFLAHIVTPCGDTIGQQIIPQLASGKMPQLCLNP